MFILFDKMSAFAINVLFLLSAIEGSPINLHKTMSVTKAPMTTEMTTPYMTTTSELPTPFGCVYDGVFYHPGVTIDEGYDEVSNWCYGTICSDDGSILNWDNFNCYTTPPTPATTTETVTTTPPTTPATTITTTVTHKPSTRTKKHTTVSTTIPTSIPLVGCYIDGTYYRPGSDIDSGNDGQSWCYGRYCESGGEISHWDNFNCFTTPPTSEPVTTIPPTTQPTTPPATTATTVTHKRSTQTKKYTTVPTTVPTTIPLIGCYIDGRYYKPGSDIDKGNDGQSWCYGKYCDSSGEIVNWDNFNCLTTTDRTITVTATPPTTRTATEITTTPTQKPITKLRGCYLDGTYYKPGSDIDKGNDGRNWCFGRYCTYSGEVAHWDEFDCEILL